MRPEHTAHDPRQRFRRLPEPVRVEDTVESHDPLPAPDPTMGRDTETEFLLRTAG
ncbi:heme biosynthesis protein HemY [Kineococcus sp. R8]|uniref:heme biosynthesis protein HemY n=1 Tax=Kineococcus siccus TaxID=2696567 RepID=UPI001411B41D|nr:heme biosynthesis protein HemY [Kineococcus siccus]NAZ82620.1 heme biosynthesis protein HemY [Kineococcus siccus]